MELARRCQIAVKRRFVPPCHDTASADWKHSRFGNPWDYPNHSKVVPGDTPDEGCPEMGVA